MCPFVENGERRCAAHMTLRNVAQAYGHCAGNYHDCPVYQQLTEELLAHDCVAAVGAESARLAG